MSGSKCCWQRRGRAVPTGTAALRRALLPGKCRTWWRRGEPQGGEKATRPGGGLGDPPWRPWQTRCPRRSRPRLPPASPRSPSPRQTTPAASPHLSTPAPASPHLSAPPPASPRLTAPRLTSDHPPHLPPPSPASQPPAQPPHGSGGKRQTLASERSVAQAGAGLLAGGGGKKIICLPRKRPPEALLCARCGVLGVWRLCVPVPSPPAGGSGAGGRAGSTAGVGVTAG